MKRIWSSFAVARGLPLGALGAHETPALAPGVRVRVTAPDGWRDVGPGSLEAIDSATIVVRRANGTTVAFPRESGTQLEVSWGPGACSGGARRGGCIALGFLGGAALGIPAGFVWVRSSNCRELCGLAFVVTVPAGAVPGTIVGAVVGGGHRGGCVALGFLGGAALGVLAPVVSSGTCRRLVCGLFVVTVPAGVVLGTIVGAVVGGEHWRTVEPRARISVGPVGPGRFAVGLSVQF